MDLSIQQTNVLKLLEGNSKQQDDEFQVLERKAQQNISIASIIVAFLGALNLGSLQVFSVNKGFLLIVVGIYALIFLFSYLALITKDWAGLPLKPTWDESQRVLNKSEEEFYDWLIASYIENINDNQAILNRKARFINWSILLIAVEILIIIAAAAFGN